MRKVMPVTLISAGILAAMSCAAVAAPPTNPKMKAKADIYDQVMFSQDALVKNPSFEAGLEGWSTYGPSGSLAWDLTDDALFGSSAATISAAGDYDLLFVNLPGLATDVEYYGFGWMKTDFKVKSSVCRIVAAAMDGSGNVIQYLYSTNQLGKSDWRLHVIKLKLKAGTGIVAFQACTVGAWGPDDTAYIDGLTFIRADKIDADLLAKLLAK